MRNWYRISGVLLFIGILMIVAMAGCASTGKVTTTGADSDFITNSYNGLKASAVSADGAMKIISGLYTSGAVSKDVKARSIKAYDKFKAAYDKAAEKLAAYSVTPSETLKTETEVALSDVGIQVAAVIALSIVQ